MNERWTIKQLTSLAGQALELTGNDRQDSGRVREVPDLRTIRYYTTLGMLDPPVEVQGRKALYSRRHLLQLVTIKRLQAHGQSLVEIQKSLHGADNRKLSRWAGLPDDFWERAPTILPPEPNRLSPDVLLPKSAEANAPERSKFWAAPVAAPRPIEAELQLPLPAVHVPVMDGVKLILEGVNSAQLDRDAFAKLRPTLEQLADILQRLKLAPAQPRSTTPLTDDPER